MDPLRTALIAIACTIAALAAGLYAGGHPADLPSPLRKAFVSDDRGLRDQLIGKIEDSYNKKVSRKQLENASLKGIVSSLHDQFSQYFTPDEAKLFQQSLSPAFEGVGMTIKPEKRGLRVVSVFDGSPAQRAGIRRDDLITGVNGSSIAGVSGDVATAKIKGRAGTFVTLSVLDPGAAKPRVERVMRAKIKVPVARGRLLHHRGVPLAYVRLATFSSGAHAAVSDQLEPLLKRGARGLILDLRGNGGGLLEEAVLVSSLFVEKGTVVSTKGRRRAEHVFEAEGDAIAPTLPMVVLVDGGTASSSEIVTGALRDNGRATVVGEKTYGKGVFQELETLANGGILDLTVGSYFLPHGENLAHRGIVPTVPARDLPKTPRDEALPVALDVLRAKVG